ncbi:MAG TPA: hydroxyacid dehydrogenase [Candidatus Aphodovivens avistercoris]|nr:hydroxyacid dehydrogenase [Candidatus Aphodovivens avistercoris]
MKLLVIGSKARTEKYLPDLPITREVETVVVERGASDDEILGLAADADFIMADAISPVSARLIAGMPNLKLIHSEGVAYNAIDLDAARTRGVFVCNNAGANAVGVAEQTVLLMLACLRDAINADSAVRCGRQIQTKERMMLEGVRELGDCRIGFIGFGAIAQETARHLADWGCEMLYNKRHRLSKEDERALDVRFASVEDIASACDIVSIHVPVTEETRGMVDAAFLARMKSDAILINTARGEIVDTEALAAALEAGTIAAAGLDTVAPEPVQLDNPLLNLSEQASRRIVLSPHIGGTTVGFFRRAHRAIWENIARVAAGEEPINIVS